MLSLQLNARKRVKIIKANISLHQNFIGGLGFVLGHALLLRSMKGEIREREIQLFDLIQVAEEFISGFVTVMLGSCVYMYLRCLPGGRQKILCVYVF